MKEPESQKASHEKDEEDHMRRSCIHKIDHMSKEFRKDAEIGKLGRVRRRGKMAPRHEFCMAGQQKAAHTFAFFCFEVSIKFFVL